MVLSLLLVLFLVALNAFFVASEFALVASKKSRIDQLVMEGDRRAKQVQDVLNDLNRYLSVNQVGITLSSLGLGWAGESTFAELFSNLFGLFGIHSEAAAHGGAIFTMALLVLSYLHIVFGELVPKAIALVKPESVSKVIIVPLTLFARIAKPFIWLLNGSNLKILKLIGIKPASGADHVHSPDEIRMMVMQSHAHGVLNESDSAMLAGVFDFHNKRARDVMRPRTEIVALHIDSTEEEVWSVLRNERYSRYPVYNESLDDMVGVFLAKDLWLWGDRDSGREFKLKAFVREALYIPDSRPAERVLDDLRKTRAHMAVVLDEYGGTAGIITMEDLVEEVIGDIADEYDQAARSSVETDGILELAGSLSLIDVRSDYQLLIPEGDWTTLGGFAFAQLGRLPKVGDRVPFPGGELEVVAMDGRRVAALRVQRKAA